MRKSSQLTALKKHVSALNKCHACAKMVPPVVSGGAVLSKVMLIGQAPGVKEGSFGKPFAWTAGKTLFRWFSSIGLSEKDFRETIYLAAVCRCFPGKNPKGGDRVPNSLEIANCASWMDEEFKILKPKLVIPVGKLAITQFLPAKTLAEVIGSKHMVTRGTLTTDLIALPHPSGASTWHRTEPGKTLLVKALRIIKRHNAFKELLQK